jgi:hypothetical protein
VFGDGVAGRGMLDMLFLREPEELVDRGLFLAILIVFLVLLITDLAGLTSVFGFTR